MNLAGELQQIKPLTSASSLPGFEYVRGFGVFSLPFDSGHVLALRVFPENDFAPYVTIWHRSPDGKWSIFGDSVSVETACPRYYGAACSHVQFSRIKLTWTGPMDLSIEMDDPRLSWSVSMTTTPLVRLMNMVSPRLPDPLWRAPTMLRVWEWAGRTFFDLGDFKLSGTMPSGHFGILMPQRMFPIISTKANLSGQDLGQGARVKENPSIGKARLPARPTFAIGRAFFKILDPVEYERTVKELSQKAHRSAT